MCSIQRQSNEKPEKQNIKFNTKNKTKTEDKNKAQKKYQEKEIDIEQNAINSKQIVSNCLITCS